MTESHLRYASKDTFELFQNKQNENKNAFQSLLKKKNNRLSPWEFINENNKKYKLPL